MLNFSPPSARRFRHGGDGTDPDPEPGRQRRGGGFRSIGTVLEPIMARCGVPPVPSDPPPAYAPPPGGLDHVAAASLLGACVARDDIAPLRRLLAAAPPAETSAFLMRMTRGDVEIGAAEAAGRWRVTGDADDLAAAIEATWAVWARWAVSPDPDGGFQE